MENLDYPSNVKNPSECEEIVDIIEKMSDLSQSQNWKELFKFLDGVTEEVLKHKDYINHTRLPGDETTQPKLITPLHYASYGKAPKNIIENLLSLGASKTLKTAEGQTAYDIAVHMNMPQDTLDILQVPEDIRKNEEGIKKMEKGLHETILGRSKSLIDKHNMQLPQLSFLYEFGDFWFPIPGMYGGFHVRKCDQGVETESWCRVAGGSGQRHLIDREGNVILTEEGFV
ncbi:unnamed protein product [Meganyctiphanes norvegica]|uniref:Ankyrin repeat domain-containing protein n=1 Tax=Meganyctiphanes norvegica TaxID=48144 RepID=A0AAV2SE23_MEGNR